MEELQWNIGVLSKLRRYEKTRLLQKRVSIKSYLNYFFEGRILQIVVPHSGHLPLRIGRPFFIVSSLASVISLFALHFTQYASAMLLASYIFSLVEVPDLSEARRPFSVVRLKANPHILP